MKKILIVLIILVSAILVLIGAFSILTSLPFYNPGMVSAQKNLQAPLTPPPQSNDPDFWDVEPGIKLYHFFEGTGRNVIVVHGGPGVPFRQPLSGLQSLTSEYKFHYYDQRGCGDSTRPFDTFTSPDMGKNLMTLDRALGLGAQIADIERIRSILGDEKIILIGHSWGGFLAALYAAEFPDRVSSLILVSPADSLVTPQKAPSYFSIIRDYLPINEKTGYEVFIKDYMNFNKLFKCSESKLVSINERLLSYICLTTNADIAKTGKPGGWMVWAMYASLGRQHDYRKALQSITSPTLVLYGSKDLLAESSARQYSELIADSRFVTINGATHFMYEEQSVKFAEAIGAFLKNK